MSARRGEQRNRYKGFPPRPWISVQIRTRNGRLRKLQLVTDTGNPVELIIGTSDMAAVAYKSGRDHNSNFGPLRGGWLQLAIPELRFTAKTPAYGNDAVLAMVRASHADFDGLAGLPLLRMFEYGGDDDWFWLRGAFAQP